MSRLLRRAAALATLLAAAGFLGYASYGALAARPHGSGRWDSAIALARQAERTRAIVPALQTRDQAAALFIDLARSGPPAARSRAAMLAGLLDVRNAGLEPDQSRELLGLAVSALQRAVRLDRGNDDAAYDLELILANSARRGQSITPTHKRIKPSKGRPGSSPVGTGY